MEQRTINRSIRTWVLIFFIAHLFVLFLTSYSISILTIVLWSIGILLYHCALGLALLKNVDRFVYIPDNTPISYVNLALRITLFRLTSIPSIMFFILNRDTLFLFLVPYLFFAVCSDFLDGRIARARNETSIIGAYLDSLSDYLLILVLLPVYVIAKIIPPWFVFLVGLRFVFQVISSIVLTLQKKRIVEHSSSFVAKQAVWMVLVIYFVSLIQVSIFPESKVLQNTVLLLELIAVPILLLSLIEKVKEFKHSLRGNLS